MSKHYFLLFLKVSRETTYNKKNYDLYVNNDKTHHFKSLPLFAFSINRVKNSASCTPRQKRCQGSRPQACSRSAGPDRSPPIGSRCRSNSAASWARSPNTLPASPKRLAPARTNRRPFVRQPLPWYQCDITLVSPNDKGSEPARVNLHRVAA